MRHILKFFVTIVTALTFSTSIEAASPPKGFQDQIKAYMENVLSDPYSARYTFDVWFGPTKTNYYIACGSVNAKNKFGGYVGKTVWQASFHNGRLENLTLASDIITPEMVMSSCRPSNYGK